MTRTRVRRRWNKTEQRKNQSHLGVETPGKFETTKILSRGKTVRT